MPYESLLNHWRAECCSTNSIKINNYIHSFTYENKRYTYSILQSFFGNEGGGGGEGPLPPIARGSCLVARVSLSLTSSLLYLTAKLPCRPGGKPTEMETFGKRQTNNGANFSGICFLILLAVVFMDCRRWTNDDWEYIQRRRCDDENDVEAKGPGTEGGTPRVIYFVFI